MKRNTSLIAGLLAFGAASLVGATAHAQVSTTEDDLILAFQAENSSETGYTTNLEVDLGPLNNFLPGGSDASGAPVSLSQLVVADLVSTYGSNWNSLTTLDWAIAGSNGFDEYSSTTPSNGFNIVFGTLRPGATIPTGQASGGAETTAGNLQSWADDLDGETSTSNSTQASDVSTSDPASFNSFNSTGSPYFGDGDLAGTFLNTTDGTTELNLMEYAPSTKGLDVGTFTMSSSGLTYEAVPEPSTWATLVLGAAMLIGFRFRRHRSAA
jgi:hypothetical protein